MFSSDFLGLGLKCRYIGGKRFKKLSAKFEKIGGSYCVPFNMHHNDITRIVMNGKYEMEKRTVLSKQCACG